MVSEEPFYHFVRVELATGELPKDNPLQYFIQIVRMHIEMPVAKHLGPYWQQPTLGHRGIPVHDHGFSLKLAGSAHLYIRVRIANTARNQQFSGILQKSLHVELSQIFDFLRRRLGVYASFNLVVMLDDDLLPTSEDERYEEQAGPAPSRVTEQLLAAPDYL